MRSWLLRYRWLGLAIVAVGLIAGFVVSQRNLWTGDGTEAVRGRLGPTPGPDAEGYVADKTAYLGRVAADDGDRVAAALVSLGRLLRATDVSSLVGSGRVDLVFTLFPGEDPGSLLVSGTVDVTVGARASELAAQRDSEISALEEEAATSEGEERTRRLQAASAKRSEANQLRGECFCLYAFVVRGMTLGDLAAMQASDDVRLVDVPDPVVADLRGWELTPLVPKGAREA